MKYKDHLSVDEYKGLKTEHQIQTEISNLLTAQGFKVIRLNSGSLPMTDKYGKKRMIKLAEKGTPDLMAFRVCPLGRNYGNSETHILFIEVKRPGKKPTPAQEMMMKELTEYGARCIVAHSVEEVQQQL